MIKWVKQIYASLEDRNLELNHRLFNLIMMAAVIVAVVGFFLSVFSGATPLGLVTMGGVAVFLALLLALANRYQKYDLCAVVMTFCVNVILFPIIFFTSGGIESGMNDWFVLGLLVVFLLLSGKALYFMLACSLISFSLCYVAEYFHPELVYHLAERKDIHMDIYVSLITTAIVTGVVIKFQKKIYEKEREFSRLQQEELEKANQTKSRFLANMSHEIRTPINAIVGFNEMNLREAVSPEVEENSENIKRASRTLLSLVNDVLDLSKIESGKMEIVPRQYEVGSMLSELVNIIWIRAHEKNLEFKLDISPEIPSMLYGDDIRVKQVLTNILTNAIKYTQKGSVTLQVKAEPSKGRRLRLVCSVADTGMGIRKEDIPYLFESFKRVNEKENGKIEGTGLGLAISKQLVELMNGKITVDSVYQRGSVFTVEMEQGIIDSTPIGAMEDIGKNSLSVKKRYRQSFEAPEARVLVVDDNEMNRVVVKKLLKGTRVRVDDAESGAKCLELTAKHYYHVIFMDHMMPEMDGIETLRRLRGQEYGLCRETPVVALTANNFSGAEELYRQKGFEGYLLKPVGGILLENMLFKLLPEELVEEMPGMPEEQEQKEAMPLFSSYEKQRLIITTESVCDISEELLKKYDIPCICYYVQTEEGRFCDRKEISSGNLVTYLSDKERKVSSMPPKVEEYETFFAAALDKSSQVLHISMAADISSGYGRALQASKGFDNVYIADSGSLSGGMGLIVLQSVKLMQEGAGAQEILAEIERLKKRVSASFILGNTDRFFGSGKMSGNLKKFCDIFMLYPAFEVKKSRIVCSNLFSGTEEAAYRSYIRRTLKGKRNIDTDVLFFTYVGCSAKTRQMVLEEVRKYQSFEHIVEQQTSAAISSNCGLGTFGLLYLRKEI